MWLPKFKTWKSSLFKEKPQPIEIFVRHCHYSAISAHKVRFETFSKQKCFANFLATLKGEKNIQVTFLLDTFHPMQEPHFVLKQSNYPVIAFKAGTEADSFLFMLEYVRAKNFADDTILYFLEDDYLHLPGWPQLLREALAIPEVDYATLYDHKDKYFLPQYETLTSKVFHTASCHWRTTPSTTNTFALTCETLKKHLEIHRFYSLGRKITADHDKFVKLAEEGAVLVSSIPGFATHAEPDYASPCIDWEKALQHQY